MKIFIGTSNVTGCATFLQQGFTTLGLSADIGLIADCPFYKATKSQVDVITLYNQTKLWLHDGNIKVVAPLEFRNIAKKYDIFIFIAAHTLLPRLTDLPTLAAMGKTIVCYQTGSELRHECTSTRVWTSYGHIFPIQSYQEVPFQDCWKDPYGHNFVNKIYNTRMIETYGTVIQATMILNSLGIRPFMRIQLPFDAQLCTFSVPKREIPLIVHAPSKMEVKRSDLIIDALHELRKEGIPFEICFLTNTPNDQVLAALSHADVLIDQIFCGCTGRLALEGMSSGCAVVTGNSAGIAWPPKRPAVSVTPTTLKEKLREVLTNKQLRIRLAAEGREYIEKGYHSPKYAAQAILDAIDREHRKEFDFYPTAFTDFAVAPKAETIPPQLRKMTLDILKKYGTHPATDLRRLEREGFIPQGTAETKITRWNLAELHELGPWNWASKNIPPPTFDPMYNTWKNNYPNDNLL